MSSKISWQEPKNRGLVCIMLGLATLIQMIIIYFAAYYFLINSFYLFLFVSLGVIALLAGAEILLAQIIHSVRLRRRQSKPSKKKRKLKKISEAWSILLGAGISIGVFSLLYFIFAINIIDPLTLTTLPIYGKFALAETLTGIILIVLILIVEAIFIQK